jgi:hypothetical protein
VGRFRNSLDLVKSSWTVLSADRELLWLPIFAMIATLITAASFAFPVAALAHSTNNFGPTEWLLAGVGYFVLAFITVFSNAALVFAANERMAGGNPSLSSAIQGAWSHVGQIAAWSAVSASVSLVLRAIEQRGGIVGRIVGALGGIAWSLVTFLVLPVLVVENVGVRDAIKRSGQLFKGTWGEQVIANAGIGLVGLAATLLALPVFFLAAAVGGPVLVLGIVVCAVWILGVMAVTTALSAVFQTALYHLDRAFRPRNRSASTW